MSKLRDMPYFKYLAEVLNKTDVDSEQWDAINGAMHQMEDQEAENVVLRATIERLEGEVERLNKQWTEVKNIAVGLCNAAQGINDYRQRLLDHLTAQEVEG